MKECHGKRKSTRDRHACCLCAVFPGNLTGFFLSDLPVPTLTSVINQEMNQLELQSASSNKSLLRVCMQYEGNGNCQVSVLFINT